jgi:hypothetical protein
MFEQTENQRENTVSIVVHLYIIRWHKWKELEGVGICVGIIKQLLLNLEGRVSMCTYGLGGTYSHPPQG